MIQPLFRLHGETGLDLESLNGSGLLSPADLWTSEIDSPAEKSSANLTEAAFSSSRLAQTAKRFGDLELSVDLLRRGIEQLCVARQEQSYVDTGLARWEASQHGALGVVLKRLGRFEEARDSITSAVQILDDVADRVNDSPYRTSIVIQSCFYQAINAEILAEAGKPELGRSLEEKVLAELAVLSKSCPMEHMAKLERTLGRVRLELGRLDFEAQQWQGAEAHNQAGIRNFEIARELNVGDPTIDPIIDKSMIDSLSYLRMKNIAINETLGNLEGMLTNRLASISLFVGAGRIKGAAFEHSYVAELYWRLGQKEASLEHHLLSAVRCREARRAIQAPDRELKLKLLIHEGHQYGFAAEISRELGNSDPDRNGETIQCLRRSIRLLQIGQRFSTDEEYRARAGKFIQKHSFVLVELLTSTGNLGQARRVYARQLRDVEERLNGEAVDAPAAKDRAKFHKRLAEIATLAKDHKLASEHSVRGGMSFEHAAKTEPDEKSRCALLRSAAYQYGFAAQALAKNNDSASAVIAARRAVYLALKSHDTRYAAYSLSFLADYHGQSGDTAKEVVSLIHSAGLCELVAEENANDGSPEQLYRHAAHQYKRAARIMLNQGHREGADIAWDEADRLFDKAGTFSPAPD